MKKLNKTLYPGHCSSCNDDIPAGVSAWWDPTKKALVCFRCRPDAPTRQQNQSSQRLNDGNSRAHSTYTDDKQKGNKTRIAGKQHQDDSLQKKWAHLINYLRRCVEREATGELTSEKDNQRWLLTPYKTEELICGTVDQADMFTEAGDLARCLQQGEVLVYGWPTLLLTDKRGVKRIGPLFVTELENPKQHLGAIIPAEDEPYLNPALLSEDYFDADAISAAVSLANDGLPFGEPTAMASTASKILAELGFAEAGLKPETLQPHQNLVDGVNNAAVIVVGESSLMTKALVTELRNLEHRTDWRNTPAAWLLGLTRPAPREVKNPVAAPLQLNDTQEQAAEQIRREYLTVVTGPPGTGKSQLVAAAISNAWIDNDTVLLSSTNNSAVDVAVERCAKIHPGLVIRTGNLKHRDELIEKVNHVLSTVKNINPNEAEARRQFVSAVSERTRVQESIERMGFLRAELADNHLKSESAAKRVWGTETAPQLNKTFRTILRKAKRLKSAWFFGNIRRRRFLRQIKALPTSTVGDVYEWAIVIDFFENGRRELEQLESVFVDEAASLLKVDEAWQATSTNVVKATTISRISKFGNSLAAIGTARRSGPGFIRALETALKGGLGWACTALSVQPNFPLRTRLFDLVIIDEASQCTVAAVLPLAYRARRLVIIGDPNQLTPVVRLDQRQLRRLATAAGLESEELDSRGLDYGAGSAYLAFEHLVGQDNVVLLEDHYRCHPLIARWFNSCFYGGRLKVLTDVSTMMTGQRGLVWVDVFGKTERGPAGGARNAVEAAMVLDILKDYIGSNSSVGVITPFAAQAALIRKSAFKQFQGEHLDDIDFTSGTAHRFQGDERDVILFSTVIAPNTPPKTARWIENQRNLLNVAVSRARKALIIFGHPEAATTLNVHTLVSLRQAAIEGLPEIETTTWLVHSESEKRLKDALCEIGLNPLLKPVEEGYELDFALLVEPSFKLNIEVDGGHHLDFSRGKQRRRDIARDRILSALGWKIIRVPAWRCLKDPGGVAAEISSYIDRGGDNNGQ